MIILKTSKVLSVLLLFAACSDRSGNKQVEDTNPTSLPDVASLVASQTGGGQDLASFLDQGASAQTIDATDGASYEGLSDEPVEVIKEDFGKRDFTPLDGVQDIDDSSLKIDSHKQVGDFEISLNELRASNIRKDQTIASLTRLNEELIAEIQRLRPKSPTPAPAPSASYYREEYHSDSHLQNLQKEIAVLKKSLLQKSEEIDGLRLRNNQFQSGIDSLQPRVVSRSFVSPELPRSNRNRREVISSPELIQAPEGGFSFESCSLEFDAVVTLLNGKSKEVFYTEFFLISQSLPDLLYSGGIFIKDFPEVRSFEELWAKSRKSPFAFPGVYKRIRNLLLEQIEKGDGYRIRTDIDGYANFTNLRTGTHYLVGTAPVGKIGAVWNVPVRLKTGTNKTSLTLANANWSE